jgi:predicted PhzF superfamily epimerase YddE/YHI9
VSVPLYQIDAFTTERFRGNPAAVCLLDAPATDSWMQSVAAEMNLSETAFLVPAATAGEYDLRWFTPTVEVDLCGHATLASAHVLWETERVERAESVRFHTRSGTLSAVDGGAAIWLDFPALPSEPVTDVPGLPDALGAAPVHVARNLHDHLVEVADAATVRALAPDFELLLAVETRAVVVTAPSDEPGYDFVSRCFAPRAGINEDPVTGSAHCALGPWWAPRVGRNELVGYQASARGGVVQVQLRGDRVALGGRAVTVVRGELV